MIVDPPLQFHKNHGTNVGLSDGSSIAKRKFDDFGNAIVFSASPISLGVPLKVKIFCDDEWKGALRVGVCSVNPSSLYGQLPRFASPNLAQEPGFWIRNIKEEFMHTESVLSIMVASSGDLLVSVDQHEFGALVSNILTLTSLWLVFDVYGKATSLKFLPSENVPIEIRARGLNAVQAYQAACKQGTIAVFRTRLMIVGQERVGKTSLCKSLTSRKFCSDEPSTEGINLSDSCNLNMSARRDWRLAVRRRSLQAGQESTPRREISNRESHRTEAIEEINSVDEEYNLAVAQNLVQELTYRKRLSTLSLPELADANKDKTEVKVPQDKLHLSLEDLIGAEIPKDIEQLVKQIIKEKPAKVKHDVPANIFLNIWDFAGQSSYFTTHQMFLTARAVYVVVFNLSKSLTEKHGSSAEMMAPLECLDFWMNSIHATQACQNPTRLSPPILIVGTHRNDLEENNINAKFDQIRKLIRGKIYERHIVDVFFAVENGAENDAEIDALRRKIEEEAAKETYMGELIPVQWLKFESELERIVRSNIHFCHLQQISEIANDCSIVGIENIRVMLQFYHDAGQLIFFSTAHEACKDIVILQPQWLISVIQRLVLTSLKKKIVNDDNTLKHLTQEALLEDHIIDFIWEDLIENKAALLSILENLGLLIRKPQTNHYFAPLCLQLAESNFCLYHKCPDDVTFYLDFVDFLPHGLFIQLLGRATTWSLEMGGHCPIWRSGQARLFLDTEHDFCLVMMKQQIMVTILRAADLQTCGDGSISDFEPQKKGLPPPTVMANAKVRNFVEGCISLLRHTWPNVHYRTVVLCICEKICLLHNTSRCSECSPHFLLLDECLSNKIVCCDHRRVKTAFYRKMFPAPVPLAKQGPIIGEDLVLGCIQQQQSGLPIKEQQLPDWIRRGAKLLNVGSEGQDWTALASRLGYKSAKVNRWHNSNNPAAALITDWVLASGNSRLSLDMLLSCLEQMMREDVVDIIHHAQEAEAEPPQVFVSYQWDSQDEIVVLRDRLERAGFSCWMDVGQMGGGDQLLTKIDSGIRSAKVIVACLTPRFIVSHHCVREITLADLLHKPIIPIMIEDVSWPPVGPSSLILAQLVYINLKGVGGHGGCGRSADIESKYRELMCRVAIYVTPSVVNSNKSIITSHSSLSSLTSMDRHVSSNIHSQAPISSASQAAHLSPSSVGQVISTSRCSSCTIL